MVNELFSIRCDDEEMKVSVRELHRALEIKERFSAWFKRIEKYFGNDEFTSVGKPTAVNNGAELMLDDHETSVENAKHICLMCRTDKGKQCRQYLIDLEKAWNTPEQVMARALKMADKTIAKLKGDNQKLIEEVNVKNQVIGELKPKADYTDKILQNKGLVTITQIAKDYGMSGQEMNKILHELGIQFKQSGQWLLYKEYHGMGYTHSETVDIVRTGGRPDVKMNTKWTQKGRLFLYNKLKEARIIPVIEKEVKE